MEEATVGQGALAAGLGGARSEREGRRLDGQALRQIGLPVLVAAVVVGCFVGLRLHAFGGNLTGFITFGRTEAHATHPPHGALVGSPGGYDGQYFFVQAHDPLVLRDSTMAALRSLGQQFRSQRMAYPALAYLLSAGKSSLLPFSLLAINVLALLILAGGFAVYARRRGWSTWWAVGLALMPGMLLPTLRDLSDPLATCCLLGAVLLASAGRRWPAAAALTVAVLARESAMAIVVAFGLELGLRAWRARAQPGGWRAIVRAGWPVVAVPGAVFAVWQLYLAARYGGPLGTVGPTTPILNLFDEARSSIRVAPAFTYAGWDVIYVLLILAGAIAAFAALRHGVTAIRLAACVASLGVLITVLGDPWGDTRLSAPLFALLLVDGLQRRNRPTLGICAAVACMTLLIPISIPGTVGA